MPSPTPVPAYSVSFSFAGTGSGLNIIYAVWIEDESGNNIQNLYVCSREAKYIGPTPKPDLTGKALPNWLTKKYPAHTDIDGVTGSSTQGSLSVTRDLAIGTVRRFKVCFEVDHSSNPNTYFIDRPSFTYSTSVIDLDSLVPSYVLSVVGWMSNDTAGSPYGQQPNPTPSGYAPYEYMTDTSYLQDASGSLADMISSAQASIAVK
jgi:hypothetical protein